MKTIITTRENGTRRVALELDSESMTEQSHADYCSINAIMARYRQTQTLPQQAGSPLYGDFTSAQDFMDCCQRIKAAEEAFETIPASIRAKFNGSIGALVEFVNDPANAEEAAKMGLIELPQPEVPKETIVPQKPSESPIEAAIANAQAAKPGES